MSTLNLLEFFIAADNDYEPDIWREAEAQLKGPRPDANLLFHGSYSLNANDILTLRGRADVNDAVSYDMNTVSSSTIYTP
jgi:hypothetical protein